MQEQAIAAVILRAKQVIVVLGTGKGKSLLFILLCTLPGASTTILVLLLVLLQGNLLCCICKIGIKHCI